ncbi:MAG: EamA family transporter [Actinomycetes bacterium]
MSRGLAVAQVLVGTALFGTVGTARALGPDASGAAVGGARALLAAAVLVPMAAWAAESWTAALRRRPVWVAGAAQASFQACFLSAVQVTGVATGTLVAIGSAPLFSGLLHRRVDRRWAAATAVAVTGLALLVLGGTEARLEPVGVLLALGAGLSYAAWTVATGRAVSTGTGPIGVSAATFTVTGVLLLPALLLADTAWLADPAGWAMVGWLALGPTVASYVLLARGLRSLAPPVVSTLGLTEPTVATALAVVVLGERLTAVGWTGALLVLAGLAGTAVVASRRRPRVGGSTS